MKIGITGATGQLGRLVVGKLKERVQTVELVALVRTPTSAVDLGVETRAFDYNAPLASALQGIDYLLLISGNELGKRAEQHARVLDAAKEAGVKWIVYTSLLHADRSSLSLATEHILTEKALTTSGIPFTILRNGWYTENYTASIPGAVQGGAFLGSAGNGRISSVARADLAEAAAVVLTTGEHRGRIYELASDQSYTLTDLAAELSKQTGKLIPYHDLSEADYAAALVSAGLSEELAQAFASFDVGASRGDLFDDGKELSALLGRPTTPLADVVRQALV
ncbi:SDR family oxidoreductase [Sphingobacterium suaedae]|uniref:SDR family oxidoreductase n=1 Tax=Sphingobacterium suaedae TaxID=1686402 RepID=A0ABW5KM35_9SPHI